MRKMSRLYCVLAAAMLLGACESSVEEGARALLDKAGNEYSAGNYNAARLLIDSLKTTYPKAYKTRREAELMRREVLLKEKERDLDFYRETIASLVLQRDSISKTLTYNKDSRFQDEGVYTAPSQAMSLNPFNSFLRASVKENGDMYITSLYRGRRISHNSVKVFEGDGFVECKAPFLTRSYKELGVYNERLDFKYGADGGIVDFIAASAGPFKVKLEGSNGEYEYTLRHDDVLAISEVLALSKVLRAIEDTRKMEGEAQRALEFLVRSQERSNAAKASEDAER